MAFGGGRNGRNVDVDEGQEGLLQGISIWDVVWVGYEGGETVGGEMFFERMGRWRLSVGRRCGNH